MGLSAPSNHLILSVSAIVVFVVAITVSGQLAGSAIERALTVFLVSLTAIAAMGLYSGRSGVLSLGHLAFMAVGAYVSALLTLPATVNGATIPARPGWLATTAFGLWPATAVAVLLTIFLAVLVGLVIWRLDGAAATIATLSLLVVMHGILIGWRDVTRGHRPSSACRA
jgi:branched-chain amino acid transport system permease protein